MGQLGQRGALFYFEFNDGQNPCRRLIGTTTSNKFEPVSGSIVVDGSAAKGVRVLQETDFLLREKNRIFFREYFLS